MVFKAELISLSLAAELVKDERQVQSLTIGIDSQAMMCAIRHRRAIQGSIWWRPSMNRSWWYGANTQHQDYNEVDART